MIIDRSLERIELRMDVRGEMSADVIDEYAEKLLGAMTMQIPSFLSMTVSGPLNLFPAISSIYLDKSEGNISKLSFQTHTASIKRESMRAREGNLRIETFHDAGVTALGGKIQPYSITVTWSNRTEEASTLPPELTLIGSKRDLSQAKPALYWAFVKNCFD